MNGKKILPFGLFLIVTVVLMVFVAMPGQSVSALPVQETAVPVDPDVDVTLVVPDTGGDTDVVVANGTPWYANWLVLGIIGIIVVALLIALISRAATPPPPPPQ